MNLTLAIPVFQPCEAFAPLIGEIARQPFRAIVIVDDGSGPECSSRFDQVRGLARIHLLRHAANQGKGAALKTAMRYALATFPGSLGVVTADGDGQHSPADIVRVASRLLEKPDCLCLGARHFDRSVPWRSRIGNGLTRRMARLVTGRALEDTQTGLRGIPASLVPDLFSIHANGYEFELEALIHAARLNVGIVEEPVTTIYYDGNRGSHFRPVRDSACILRVLIARGVARSEFVLCSERAGIAAGR